MFTVGPSGAFATLQAGIDAALAAGGANEVRVQEGTFFEEAVTKQYVALPFQGLDSSYCLVTASSKKVPLHANLVRAAGGQAASMPAAA